MSRWSDGETIVVQELWRGRLWAARPVTVVSDRSDELVLWCPKGTVRKVPVTPATRQEPSSRPEWFADLLSRCDWELTDSVWDVSTLWIVGAGDWHSVWVSFRDNGEHFGYYINLERPFRRSRAGIQTMDLMLDVIADRNGSWRWKDEDDLEILLAKGLIDGATGQRVRNEAMRAIQRFQLSEAPFDGSWTSWRPPASWRAPRLAPGWEDVRD